MFAIDYYCFVEMTNSVLFNFFDPGGDPRALACAFQRDIVPFTVLSRLDDEGMEELVRPASTIK